MKKFEDRPMANLEIWPYLNFLNRAWEKSIRDFVGWEKLVVGKKNWENGIWEKLVCKKLVTSQVCFHLCDSNVNRSLPLYILPDDDSTFLAKPSLNKTCTILVIIHSRTSTL